MLLYPGILTQKYDICTNNPTSTQTHAPYLRMVKWDMMYSERYKTVFKRFWQTNTNSKVMAVHLNTPLPKIEIVQL